MTQQGGETGIPILTEVIGTTVHGVDVPERRAQPRPPAPTGPDTMSSPVAFEHTAADDGAAFDRLAASIRAQVLQQLLDQADASFEQRIRNSLADTLQAVVAQLTMQMRQSLQQTLEGLVDELVTDAIARELPDRQISKN